MAMAMAEGFGGLKVIKGSRVETFTMQSYLPWWGESKGVSCECG